MAEPDAGRTTQIGSIRNYNFGAGAGIDTKEMDSAKEAVNQLTGAVEGLAKAFTTFNQNADRYSSKLESTFKKIRDSAKDAADQIARLATSTGGTGGGGGSGITPAAAAAASGGTGGTGGTPAAATGTGSSWVNTAITSAAAWKSRGTPGGSSLGQYLGDSGGDLLKDIGLAPIRWLRDRISTNRDTAIMTSGALGSIMMQQGINTNDGQKSIMQQLSQRPGGIYGNVEDFLSIASATPALGASFGFGGQGGQGVRASGFYQGVQQLQQMTPTASVGSLVETLGGYAGNTKAQQQSVMMTGGAFSMIGTGGRQKSIDQWGDTIMKWLVGLRPGSDRNKAFTHAELMSQYFPGSNIDAWLTANGVTPGMKDAFWTYALSKAAHSESGSDEAFKIAATEGNVAYNRLKASSELTRTEFDLAGNMSGAYANREQANRWFNSLMGGLQRTLIPAIGASNSLGGIISQMPDTVEDLLMTGVERGASALAGLFGDQPDVGDSYGEFGGTGLSGLHPDMKTKVGRMMRANPRLTMTSSLRDTGLQQKLKAKGHNRVSGKPSAHTRGMAADLGPASEYGWISQNASKFGLASGKGFGEPWHVGMKGDVGDINFDAFDDITSIFTKMFSSDSGGITGWIENFLTTVFGKLTSWMGAGSESNLAFNPDQLKNMTQKKTYEIGIPAKKAEDLGGPLGWIQDALGGAGGGTGRDVSEFWPDDGSGGGSGGTLANFFTQVLNGLGVPASQINLDKMGAVARQEGYVAGAYNPWNSNSKAPGSVSRNSAGIQGYPDEATGIRKTIELLSTNSRGRPAMIENLRREGSFEEFIDRTEYYYYTWDKSNPQINPNQSQGHEYLTTPVGDMPEVMGTMAMMPTAGKPQSVVFQNTFNLGGGGGGMGSNGGIDARYAATVIADHLESEMKRRLTRVS